MQQHPSDHPVSARTGHTWARFEPIALGLSVALILLILSLIVRWSEGMLTLAEVIFHFSTLAGLIAGGAWARQRVISVDTYNDELTKFEHYVRQEANKAREQVQRELDEQLAEGVGDWQELEEALDPGSLPEQLPDIGE